MTDLSLANQPSKWDDKFDIIVKHFRDRRPDSDPKRTPLPKDLALQLQHWITIHGLLSTGVYPKTTDQLNAILTAIPGLSPRTARNYLEDTKRFFAMADQPNLEYERLMQIEEVREDIRTAKLLGDMKALAAFRKIYIELIGANKPLEAVDNRTIINIINYNPEQLGGQVISDEALDNLINRLMADDQKKQDELFDDYQDVSPPNP